LHTISHEALAFKYEQHPRFRRAAHPFLFWIKGLQLWRCISVTYRAAMFFEDACLAQDKFLLLLVFPDVVHCFTAHEAVDVNFADELVMGCSINFA
jgi:hypothetical protein